MADSEQMFNDEFSPIVFSGYFLIVTPDDSLAISRVKWVTFSIIFSKSLICLSSSATISKLNEFLLKGISKKSERGGAFQSAVSKYVTLRNGNGFLITSLTLKVMQSINSKKNQYPFHLL